MRLWGSSRRRRRRRGIVLYFYLVTLFVVCVLLYIACVCVMCVVIETSWGAVARLKKYLYTRHLLLFFLLHGKSKLSIMPSTLSINCRNRTLVMALSLALLAGFQGLGIANLKNKPMGKSAYHLLRHFSEYVNDAFLSQLSHTHTQQTSFWLCVLLSFGESK